MSAGHRVKINFTKVCHFVMRDIQPGYKGDPDVFHLTSPIFRTCHSGLGIDWQLLVLRERTQNIYKCFVGLRDDVFAKKKIPFEAVFFIEKNGEWINPRLAHRLRLVNPRLAELPCIQATGIRPTTLPPVTWREIAFGELSVKSHQHLHIGVVLQIPETVFEWKKYLETEAESTEGKTISQAYDDVKLVRFGTEQESNSDGKTENSRPNSDTLKILDFRIYTTDNCVIWCHKIVLGKKNDVLRRMVCFFQASALVPSQNPKISHVTQNIRFSSV